MKTKLFLAALAAVSLAGCSLDQINFLPAAKISASIPEVTFDAVYNPVLGTLDTTNKTQIVSFRAQSGSMGARIKGFDVVVEDQAGQRISAITPKRQTLNAQVAPGKTCDPKTGACVFEVGTATQAAIDFLTQEASGVIAEEWVRTSRNPNLRARITFLGVNTNGVDFQWEELQTINCNCTIDTKTQ